MPFSPSDLPWWGWLLCSIGTGIVCLWFIALVGSNDSAFRRGFMGLVIFLSGLTALITGLMGLIRFIKWVWSS
jgi:hypothetical protein